MPERLRFFFFDRFQRFRLIRRIDALIVAVFAGSTTERTPACISQNAKLEKTSPARLHYFIACTIGAMTLTRIEHHSATFQVQRAPFPHGRLEENVATRKAANKR
jgi:hypothetical protein